ncbi:conserved hypothetical protein [Desulfotalea psychrophila LSv54]|uniref:DUF4125 family protein n=2 Tax=Desulfotalea psychrophila TaxID=84980 RepID=Q6AQR0_DESPS|nr:conserved hypothetical protein [Desulfotalea psychrophila LSv54]
MGRTIMDREKIVEEVLAFEWQMFIRVNDSGGKNPLEKSLPSVGEISADFRLHRTSQLAVWSEATLQSYLRDLGRAHHIGRNLMIYKYARMGNLIPSENESPFIAKIVSAQLAWQRAFIDKHPRMMSRGRQLAGEEQGLDWASFSTYVQAELETYAEETLKLLYKDVQRYQAEGRSMSEEIYDHLAREQGYASADAAEKKQ